MVRALAFEPASQETGRGQRAVERGRADRRGGDHTCVLLSGGRITYDALDRVKTITYDDQSSISYEYDANGNVTRMTDDAGPTDYTYDALNRLKTESPLGSPTTSYTYDLAGNLTSVADPGGTVSYSYNANDQVATLTEPNMAPTSFSYDADGNRTETKYPNGIAEEMVYDASDRLSKIFAQRIGGAALNSFTYSYTDPATQSDTDLRQSVTGGAGDVTTYKYDALNRLTQAKTVASGGAVTDQFDYGYDGNSNRTTQTVNGSTTSYSYNEADELVGPNAYSYDANDNLLAKGGNLAFVYNARDQTTSITPPSNSTVSMTYAGEGQSLRTQAGSTSFLTNALGLGRETTGSSGTYYTRDPGGILLEERSPTGNYYYLFDGLGSVVALSDSSGNIVNTYSYEPFGKAETSTGTVANPYRFSGGDGTYYDASTGLHKMGERYYDQLLGRFTQIDPIPGGSLNAYDYAGQDPINNSDATGMYCNSREFQHWLVNGTPGSDCGNLYHDYHACMSWPVKRVMRDTPMVPCYAYAALKYWQRYGHNPIGRLPGHFNWRRCLLEGAVGGAIDIHNWRRIERLAWKVIGKRVPLFAVIGCLVGGLR